MSAESIAKAPESGRYRFVRDLAEGGMGKVEIAVREEARFRRVYAIKRLRAELSSDPDIRAMFLEEARIAGLLRHPNLVGVIDTGEDERGPFLVMDFVEGVPLSTVITTFTGRGEALPVQLCVNIARQVADGLHAAHELRDLDGKPLDLVHRDVSPQNIILGFDGVARLTDFGIAKAIGRAHRTSTGILKGKSGYFSPEQLQFEEPDRRSDIFCLGIVLFELLSGKRLYGGDSPMTAAKRILREPPPDIHEVRQDVHPMLVKLLFEMLAKDREHRPADALAVERQLDRILSEITLEEDAIRVADFVNEHFSELRDVQREEIRALSALTPVDPALALAKTELAVDTDPLRERETARARRTPSEKAPAEPEADTLRNRRPVPVRWLAAVGVVTVVGIGAAGTAITLDAMDGGTSAEPAPEAVVPAAATAPSIPMDEPAPEIVAETPMVEQIAAPEPERVRVRERAGMRESMVEAAEPVREATIEAPVEAAQPVMQAEATTPEQPERRNQELMTWPEGPVSPRSSP
jgi:serine/threonine-protein kinase